MLSIGKVGGGNADPRYYIDTVVQGKDDYYGDRGEAPGTWYGAGAEDRGLDGSVGDEEFMNVLVEPTAKTKTVLAYDLTFSAPKSVSVLYGDDHSVAFVSLRVRKLPEKATRRAQHLLRSSAVDAVEVGAVGHSRLGVAKPLPKLDFEAGDLPLAKAYGQVRGAAAAGDLHRTASSARRWIASRLLMELQLLGPCPRPCERRGGAFQLSERNLSTPSRPRRRKLAPIKARDVRGLARHSDGA